MKETVAGDLCPVNHSQREVLSLLAANRNRKITPPAYLIQPRVLSSV